MHRTALVEKLTNEALNRRTAGNISVYGWDDDSGFTVYTSEFAHFGRPLSVVSDIQEAERLLETVRQKITSDAGRMYNDLKDIGVFLEVGDVYVGDTGSGRTSSLRFRVDSVGGKLDHQTQTLKMFDLGLFNGVSWKRPPRWI